MQAFFFDAGSFLESPRLRLWSLLDMLRFYAEGFVNIAMRLAQIRQTLEAIRFAGASIDMPVDVPPIEKDLLWLYDTLKGLDLPMSTISAEKMLSTVKSGNKISGRTLMDLSDELQGRIHDELKIQIIFMIPKAKADFYNPDIPIFGNSIETKIPDHATDIREAGNCYAVGRYTACVFHLMRVIERAVQELGNNLGVSLVIEKEWQKIVNDIRGTIIKKFINPRDPDRIKYESILGHLETIKIAWRNPTMHPKATYTEEEAEHIIHAVKIFLEDLAKIL